MQHRMQSLLEGIMIMNPTGRILKTPAGALFGWGTTVGNSLEGWAPGALFIDTDAAAGSQQWINEGSVTTASWKRKEAGNIELVDSETIVLGTGSDVSLSWNGSILTLAPPTGMWANCPLTKYANGHTLAYEFFDDFWGFDPTASIGQWIVTEDDAADTQTIGTALGGSLLLTQKATTDNDGSQIQLAGAPFKFAANKHLWFEALVKTAAGATEIDMYCGLAADTEDLTGVADNMAQDGALFHKDDGATTLKFSSSKDGTNDTNASAGTWTTGWHTLGFYVNGVTSITPYFDGTAKTAVSTTICNDEALSPILGVRNGDATTTQTLEIDYVKCVQLR